MKEYIIKKIDKDSTIKSESLSINSYHSKSSTHQPETNLTLHHDTLSLFGHFIVHDQYVIVTREEYNSDVYNDSCVELFIQIPSIKGYLNFEFSAGGVFRVFHIVDHERIGFEFKEYYPIPFSQAKNIVVKTTLGKRVYPQINTPLTWELRFEVPLKFFRYLDPKVCFEGTWQGNAFKCAGDSTHPHWGSWIPIGEELNFHKPECFGYFYFNN